MSAPFSSDVAANASTELQDKNKTPAEPSSNFIEQPKKDRRFWAIICGLSITAVLAAIDGTIITTSLPSISADLGGGEKYIWVSAAYFLVSTALQPLFGQTANIFGRRNLILFSIAVFILGSGICGGANTMNMLIAGRSVQGVGSAGITLLVEVIVCDLVPLRERGQYTAIVFSTSIVGSALGPWIGGQLTEKVSWRWVFFINLPIGGAALAVLFFALHVNYRKANIQGSLWRIDYIGNALFVASTVALMFGLVYGGVIYPWGSWRVIVPIILGVVGLALFALWERSSYCLEPSMPRQIFGNRTSVGAILLSFIHMSIMTWTTYFLAVYFQAVRGASPAASGVDLLPIPLAFSPAGAVAGIMLTKFGRYRPYHMAGFAIMTIGVGLFSILSETTITAGWILLQVFVSIGCGIVMPSLLPAAQAELSDKDTAAATALLSVARAFGQVWGTTIPSVIFNNQFDNYAGQITNTTIRASLVDGQAYAHATSAFVNSLDGVTRAQVILTYDQALKLVWYVGAAFAGAGFLVVFLEKEVKLRADLDTEYGIKEEENEDAVAAA